MSDVLLPIAKVPDGRLIHVSERLPANAQLCCPYCNSGVIKKAGSVRRHHYAHQAGSNCSVSPETLLHDGAKVFLYNSLVQNKPIDILVDVSSLNPSKTKSLLQRLSLKQISVSTKFFYDNPNAEHYLEGKIGSVRADVLSYSSKYRPATDTLAWEIYVTHAVDEDKSAILADMKVPFIELSPTEDGLNQYIYQLKNYDGIQLIDDDAILLKSLFEDNMAELAELFKVQLGKVVIEDAVNDARLQWQASEVNKILEKLVREVNSSIGHVTSSEAFGFTKANSILIHPVSQYDLAGVTGGNWVKLESVDCEKYKDKYVVVLNKKYQFLSSLGMLKCVYEKLSDSGLLTGLLVDDENGTYTNDKLVGVSLTVPVADNQKTINIRSVLYKYASAECKEVEIYEFGSKKSKKTDIWYMTVNEGVFVDSYEWQLKNILFNLMKHYEIQIHLSLNAQNKQRANAIKIVGLCDVASIKDTLLGLFNGVIRSLK